MKRVLLIVLFCAGVVAANAQAYLQNPNYGATEAERTENAKLLSAYQVSYNLKDYARATYELKQLLERVPKATENIYIRGVEIYKNLFAKAETDKQRGVYLDSILVLFDLRAENFKDHPKRGIAYVIANKALTYNNYVGDGDKAKLYDVFRNAVEVGREVIDEEDVEVIGTYFTALTDAYKYDEITADDYLTRYDHIMKVLDGVNNEHANKIRLDVETLFAQSGAASCDNIVKIFKPQYDADPENGDLMKKILGLFSRAKCNNDFQAQILEKYYKIDPQPEFAAMLAGMYEEKKEYAKAMEYMKIAIENEKTDMAKKMSFILRASGQLLAIERYKEAAEYAKMAMDLDPNNGIAYYIYANAVNSGLNNCSVDNRGFALWLIYDLFSQAYNKLPEGDPQRENARTAMNQCASNFPKKTDLFMNGMEEGAGYTVNCGWVSGRTTVRGRN